MKNKNMLIFFGAVVLAFFGIFIKMNYSVDTYLLFASENLGYIQEYIRSGRFFTAFLFKFLQFLRFKPEVMYVVSFIIGIICVSFSIYILFKILNNYINNIIISSILSIMIIINPFIIELWLFVEMGIMMLSILSCVLAYKYFDKYLVNHQNKEIVLSILFMTIALFSYQGTVALFVALSAISIVIHSINLKILLKNSLTCFVIYGIPTLVNFLIVMFIGNTRVGVDNNIIEKINFILLTTKEQLFNGFGLYPNVLFKTIHICTFAIVFFYIVATKGLFKQKLHNIVKFVYIVFLTYFFTILTIIPQDINSLVMYPRNSYAYGSIIGLVFAFLMICINKDKKVEYMNKLIIIITVILLSMEFIQFNIIGINRYIVNYMDKYIVLEIEEKISKYENETGNKIKNIAIYNTENSKLFYQGIDDKINISAKNEEMSRTAIMVLLTHRKFNKEQPNEKIYNEYFKDKNWTMFNLEQIVLQNDTMHWYLY